MKMVAVGIERLHTHHWILRKSWATVVGNRGQRSIRLVIAWLKVLWRRRGATGLKTFSNKTCYTEDALTDAKWLEELVINIPSSVLICYDSYQFCYFNKKY